MAKRFTVFKSLNININTMLKDTIEYLTNKYNQSLDVFTAASPFGQLLIVLENLTQLILYYIEDSITELSIYDATRTTSVYSLASLAGHSPSRAVAASGEVSFVTNANAKNADIDNVIIPTFTRIQCLNNGLTYVIIFPSDYVKFALNGKNNGTRAQILQGRIETQRVIARGIEMESFSISSQRNFLVDNFFVNVYVNGEKWNRYESILDMPKNEKGYVVKTGVTSGVDLYFGNNYYGRTLDPGAEVIIEYLLCEGAAGNITTNNVSQVKFTFVDGGYTAIGEDVDLNEYISINTVNSPNFGINPEDIELTRLIAPKTSKSFALVNIDHYESVLRRLNIFSLIRVFLDEQDNRMLNLFLIPDISKAFNTGQDYFNVDPDKFKLSDYQKSEILKYIKKSGSELISTDNRIIDPIIVKYVLNITIIVYDDVDIEIIKNDIYNALGSFFINNKRRSRIPKSDLIKIVEEVNGVDSVAITIVSEENEKAKKENPDSPEVGLDEFNDIVTTDYELPIISGGWSDRYGNEYSTGISDDSLGPVNIQVKSITKRQLTQ